MNLTPPPAAALLAEAFGREIVFERPPAAVQRALVAAVVAPERWPGPDG